MPKLYGINIYKSMGGRGTKEQWSNEYFVSSDLEIDDPALLGTIDAIVAAEKTAHVTEVHFMRAHMKQKADNLINTPPDVFVTRELEGTGAREVEYISIPSVGADPVYRNPITPLDVAIEVSRSAATGRAGRLFYRGCLLVDDIQPGNTGEFVLKTPTIFSSLGGGTNTLVDMLNTALPEGTFVLPERAGITYQASRPVTRHTLAGVTILKRNRKRLSIGQAEKDIARRVVRKLIKDAEKLLAGGAASALTGAAAIAFAALQAEATALEAALPAAEWAGVLEAPELIALGVLA